MTRPAGKDKEALNKGFAGPGRLTNAEIAKAHSLTNFYNQEKNDDDDLERQEDSDDDLIDGSKSGVSTQQRIACREAFSSYDASGDGKVDIGTLGLVLKAVGVQAVTKFKLDGIVAEEVSNKD